MYVSLFHHGEFYYTLLFRSSYAKVQHVETGSSASSGTRKSFVVNKCYSQMSNKLKIVLNLGSENSSFFGIIWYWGKSYEYNPSCCCIYGM